MRQEFVIVCESAIVAKDTGNLYILGIFENVSVPGVPVLQPKLVVVTRFSEATGEHKHEIVIRHDSGIETARLQGKINFGTNNKAQYIGTFIGLTFPKIGMYYIEIYADGILQPMKGEFNVNIVHQ